jgi:hypothetical protein
MITNINLLSTAWRSRVRSRGFGLATLEMCLSSQKKLHIQFYVYS